MNKFLLDANLSPQTRRFLEKTYNFDVIDLITEKQSSLADQQVVNLAKQDQRIIITFDLDFGEIYHFSQNKMGVIVLRIDDQTVESVNRILNLFFQKEAKFINLKQALVIIEENKIRIIK